MTKTNTAQLHATAVVVNGVGFLILGPSGSGKSDLALRLLDDGARLVADDRTDIRRQGDALIASAPAALRGLIEVRGIGIITLPDDRVCTEIPLGLALRLTDGADIPRLPEPGHEPILGVDLPLYALDPKPASAMAKVHFLLLNFCRL